MKFNLARFLSNFKLIQKPQYYDDWVSHFKAMIVHTRKAAPVDVLLAARPNEQPEVHTYRIQNHRAITYGAMVKAFDRLFRIFNTLSFSWKAPKLVEEYIKENKFYKHSFAQFMSQNVLKNTIDDANGLLVWLPDGEGLYDNSKKLKPRPEIVASSNIKYFDSDVLIYETYEDIAKHVELREEPSPYKSYVVLTKEEYGIFFYFEDDKKDIYQPIFTMKNFDELPVIILGGIDCGGYYESFFSPFLAFGDEAIARFSDWQGVTIMCGYPQIEELEMECDAKGCNDGYVSKLEGKGADKKSIKVPCGSCHGTGIRANKGPFAVFKRRVQDLDSTDPEDKTIGIPARRFNSPNSDILNILDGNWKGLLQMGEDALHLVYTKEAQSGVAKDIDREDGDSTINKISDRHFDIHWWYSLKYIGMYLMPGTFKTEDIKLSKPLSFRLRSVSDLLEEIATLKEKNAPIIIILNVVRELFNKRFSYDEVSRKIFEVIFENDPLSVYSVLEQQSLLLGNTIQPETVTNNLYLFQTLLKISKQPGMDAGKFILTSNDELYKMALKSMSDFYSKPIEILPTPPVA